MYSRQTFGGQQQSAQNDQILDRLHALYKGGFGFKYPVWALIQQQALQARAHEEFPDSVPQREYNEAEILQAIRQNPAPDCNITVGHWLAAILHLERNSVRSLKEKTILFDLLSHSEYRQGEKLFKQQDKHIRHIQTLLQRSTAINPALDLVENGDDSKPSQHGSSIFYPPELILMAIQVKAITQPNITIPYWVAAMLRKDADGQQCMTYDVVKSIVSRADYFDALPIVEELDYDVVRSIVSRADYFDALPIVEELDTEPFKSKRAAHSSWPRKVTSTSASKKRQNQKGCSESTNSWKV